MPAAFEWLRRSRCAVSKFECLRRFYGFAVSMALLVSGFLWLRRFWGLRPFLSGIICFLSR